MIDSTGCKRDRCHLKNAIDDGSSGNIVQVTLLGVHIVDLVKREPHWGCARFGPRVRNSHFTPTYVHRYYILSALRCLFRVWGPAATKEGVEMMMIYQCKKATGVLCRERCCAILVLFLCFLSHEFPVLPPTCIAPPPSHILDSCRAPCLHRSNAVAGDDDPFEESH